MFASLFVLRALLLGGITLAADLAQIASLFVGRRAKRVAKRASQHVRGAGNKIRHARQKVRTHLSVRGKPHRHPARQFTDERNFGERAADIVAGGMGSWSFIGLQTLLILCWIAGNVYLLDRAFDPFPFILLNLAFSTQAAYAAPILQLAGNRTASKDRVRDDREAEEVEMIVTLLQQNTALTGQVKDLLEQNTTLTKQVADLTQAVHDALTGDLRDHVAPIATGRRSVRRTQRTETLASQSEPTAVQPDI